MGYTLDNQYRLTSETITGDPNPALNGRTDWDYDLVGNRLSQQTDIGDLLDLSETYSANNWLDSHTYDSNGKTRKRQTRKRHGRINDTTHKRRINDTGYLKEKIR